MPKYPIEKEYETLRNEILDGKKYVFERPVLIITGSIALFQFVDNSYAIYFPFIIIGLLFFNLWFTVNRMRSIGRIVAYIQLILESGNNVLWHGWETSLRNYRKWTKQNSMNVANLSFDDKSVYDNLGYYPTIYILHIIVSLLLFAALFVQFNSIKSYLLVIFMTLGELILFLIYSILNRPAKIKPNIEINRIIWQNVFENWDKLESK